MQFIKPTEGLITSFFSPQRKNPVTGILKPHSGCDIGWYGTDDKVYAMASGKVVVPKYSNTAGNYIWIEHGNGYTSVYSHLKTILVKNGQHIKQGYPIGIKGTTGNSTGVHLHLELIKHHTFSNDWNKKVNPLVHFVDNTTKQWQGWLKDLGYYAGSVDGIYGDSTIKAVFEYQKKNKISADGVCGRSTYAHIKSAYSKLDKNKGELTMSQYKELLAKIEKLEKEKADKPTVTTTPSSSHREAWEWLVKETKLSDGSDAKGFLTREQFSSLLKRYHEKFVDKKANNK